VSDQTRIPRRAFIVSGLAVLVGGFLAWRWQSGRHGGSEPAGEGSTELAGTLLAFLGALFGHELSEPDTADLSERLAAFTSDADLRRDCETLVRHLDHLADAEGASGFRSCSATQQERIVGDIMRIDPKTFKARLLSKFFPARRDLYHMRWSAVPSLAWMYRHSAAAWRTRGYARWPGVPGDWREVTQPGPPYPS
jgi:hypothetical protein